MLNFLNEQIEKKRVIKNDLARLESVYAPNLDLGSSLLDLSVIDAANCFNLFTLSPTAVSKSVVNGNDIEIQIHVQETNMPKKMYSLIIEQNQTPSDIIVKIIHLKLSSTNNNEMQINEIIKRYKDAYLLSVCGCDEILFGNKCPIGSYKVIFNSAV